ncbi:hypothetical protein SEA_TELAVIV_11 [Mycobacterium phage TelAviv]|uniref:Uncharacterized protein n=4 Tax=Viruses TaxID=10239 RepID=Q856T1_BPMCO|nr:gp13 [Mycobacterium phage Corndog]YP_008530576.1 hypothetical protein PBI_DYLAN_12 [Mycobacterium phage Dylan]YP_009014375.1 hypothetical protein CL96_gp012 [Mycobacterium phage Firecracker]ALA48856.1 hypothetical protein ZAKHE101_13 [Mycobacterium phage Zakhe101]QPO16499.1 hypothetical protein SEA_TELAVIV_11 [Mycobacterium phage TelAviv]QWY81497.1 hypothetical protein SEA_WINGET_12 [Mycobacterium phage Winget]WUT94661.1 hypothetical protein SUAREZ_13 [Mycobacterium phage Suarez]AAN01945.
MPQTDLEDLRWAVETLRWAKQRKAEIKEAEESARLAIETALGNNDEGTLDGHVVVRWKPQKRNALDQKLLKAAFPEIYEGCKTITEVRRFEVLDD